MRDPSSTDPLGLVGPAARGEATVKGPATAHERSPALSKIRAEWPTVAEEIERGDAIALVRERLDAAPAHHYGTELFRALDALDVEIARGDFDDPALRAEQG